ncbi:hypothetical protein PV350_04185 [Streptomyces sp. PA03-6a]|nr:hypothetical protein [Streptomyces sp. PA03-6a]
MAHKSSSVAQDAAGRMNAHVRSLPSGPAPMVTAAAASATLLHEAPCELR